MYRNLGFADGLGYGFCRDCQPKDANKYTPEAEERCERWRNGARHHRIHPLPDLLMRAFIFGFIRHRICVYRVRDMKTGRISFHAVRL
jgi:hypothetical protein